MLDVYVPGLPEVLTEHTPTKSLLAGKCWQGYNRIDVKIA